MKNQRDVASPFRCFVTTSVTYVPRSGVGAKWAKKKTPDWTSRQIQAGIGHSAPAHRGGHVQNRIRRRQALWGKIGPGP